MIRQATPDDIPALVTLGARMHAESRFAVLAYNPEKAGRTLAHVLETGFLWVATDDDRIVGGMAAMCVPHWCSDDAVAMDLALFVEPESRGGMAAARLVTRYKEWADKQGAVMIDMGVNTGVHVEQTTSLLERLGFKRCGVILES